MAFFARPNLDNVQFKQLDGSELTLSGQTQIATISGLTLATGDTNGTGVIITASGASAAMNNYVLTYDDVDKKIKLKESGISGGTGYYNGASPTTCSVGGLTASTEIFNCSIVDIIQCMVAPNVPPVITSQSVSSFTLWCTSSPLTPISTLYEIGTCLCVRGCTCFNRGCINPYYQGSPPYSACYRSIGASGYSYGIYGNPAVFACDTNPSNFCDFLPHSAGTTNTLSVFVNYCCGPQPYYSDCTTPFGTALVASATTTCNRTISGVYPWYWGKSTTVPITNTCVSNGTKVVAQSTGTLAVCFNSTPSDYLWLAIPTGTTKTCWYVNGTNNGPLSINPADTWASACIVTGVTSTLGCWSNRNYNVYVTRIPTGTDPNVPMCFY